jgi:hypothetical protein
VKNIITISSTSKNISNNGNNNSNGCLRETIKQPLLRDVTFLIPE